MKKNFLRKKLALMLGNLKKKKPYYCEVEYLESTGTQWIDTGIIGTENTAVSLVITPKQINTKIFGARTATSQNNISVFYGSSADARLGIDFNNSNYATYRCQYNTLNQKVVISLDKNSRTIKNLGDTVLANNNTVCTDSITTPNTLRLFDVFNGFQENLFIGECNLCQIRVNGTLVRDYIPVLDWNMRPCMFDKVSGELFYNQGSGEFLYGREIHEVEYLESTGTQFIDTGLFGNLETKAEIVLSISTQAVNNTGIFGSRGNSANSNLLAVGNGITDLATDFNNSSYALYRASLRYELDKKYICYTSKEKRFIKDENSLVLAENNTLCNDNISTSNLLLFAETGINYRHIGKIFYAKIWDGNTLVRDYIPAIDENGKGFMFDRVTHTIFDNLGSGEFKYPPVELEYIESSGTQYIDTGIVGTRDDIGIDITWQFSNADGNMCVFSSRTAQTSQTFTLFWLKTLQNRVRFDAVGQKPFANEINTVDNEIYNFKYKSEENAVATLTNKTTNQSQILQIGKITSLSTNPLYLLFSRDSGNVASWIKLRKCQITYADTLVRDFIPCFKDGQAGVWDKANKVFYPNAGTDVFLVGKIVEKGV